MAHASKERAQTLQTAGAELPLTHSEVREFLSLNPRRATERIEIEEFEELEELEDFEELEDKDAIFLRTRPGEDILSNRPFGLRRTEQSADYRVDVASLHESRGDDDDGPASVGAEGASACEGLPYIGQQLRAGRRALGWGLADLADRTKISVAQLKLMEEGREQELPGRVFVRGFVRCCARALELDADDLVERLADPAPAPRAATAGEKLRQGHALVGQWTASVPRLRQGSFALYASMALLVLFVTLFALVSDFLSTASVQSL